jgi:hypothetical protein
LSFQSLSLAELEQCCTVGDVAGVRRLINTFGREAVRPKRPSLNQRAFHYAFGQECLFSDQRTALHWAARCGHTDVVALLLQSGADLNAKDINGKTSIMLAAVNGQSHVVRFLVDAGGDVDEPPGMALGEAIRCLKMEAASELIRGGASLGKAIQYGYERCNNFHIYLQPNLGPVFTLLIDNAKKDGTKAKFVDEDEEVMMQKMAPREVALACK